METWLSQNETTSFGNVIGLDWQEFDGEEEALDRGVHDRILGGEGDGELVLALIVDVDRADVDGAELLQSDNLGATYSIIKYTWITQQHKAYKLWIMAWDN